MNLLDEVVAEVLERLDLSRFADRALIAAVRGCTVRTSTGDAFVEMERLGVTVVQLGNMRIVIARPPFSDAIEITAVLAKD